MNQALETRATNILGILERIKNGANAHKVNTLTCLISGGLEVDNEEFLLSVVLRAENYAAEIVTKRVWWK